MLCEWHTSIPIYYNGNEPPIGNLAESSLICIYAADLESEIVFMYNKLIIF